MDRLGSSVGSSASAGSNPGPGENFSLKLTIQDVTEGCSEKLNFHQKLPINKTP